MVQTIIAALDINDEPSAKHVAETANRLAKAEGAALHVLTVVADSGMAIVSSYLGPDHQKRMCDEAEGQLRDFADKVVPGLPADQVHVVAGTIYDQILRTAKRVGADLIVVGSHRPELKDYLIGPNAARVARHAVQSVYVVR